MISNSSVYDRYSELCSIPSGRFPKHLLIIPDGNGRWAQQQGKYILYGHKKGAKQIKEIIRDLCEIKEIKIVTLWGFSADNWKRGEKEVKGLFQLIQHQIEQTIEELKKHNARFVHLGRTDRISKTLLDTMTSAEEETKNSRGQIVCAAIDFGGEDQELRIIEQVRKLPDDIKVSKELLWQLRDGHGLIPPADLLIRTSGEYRTSDVGWLNGAPTELYFIEKLFPEITTGDIVKALVNYSKRERRFGGRK